MEDGCSGGAEKDGKENRPKSILKHTHEKEKPPEVKWDEMNILETYHPANKDYGHMKINEPPTPYSHLEDSDEELDTSEGTVDPQTLTESLSKASTRKHVHQDDDDDSDGDADLTEEAKAKKKEFKSKRSHHYDEFSKVRLARELIAKELAELDKDEEDSVQESHKMDTGET